MSGKKFVVTAGATREAIDPVRYISNHSTGKMGYAIAEVLAERGAEVTLVSGATALDTPKGVERVNVESAAEMFEATKTLFESESCDGAVFCAAVADYTPVTVAQNKIKKGLDGGETMTIELKKTVDIAKYLGERKSVGRERITVGFALETENERVNAEQKLERKKFDFIVLNSMRDSGAGFGVDTNKVTIIDRESAAELPLMDKREVAQRIADKIEVLCYRA